MPDRADSTGAETHIVRGVLRLARAMRRAVPTGETSGGALSLLVTLHNGGPMSAVALAQREGLQPQSLSRLLVRLEQEGSIERSLDPADHRRHVIVLTQTGLMALERAMNRRRVWLASAMARRLAPDERETLARAADLMLRIATDSE
jgi:DNA-binding MarR family transcriptional regulator